MDLKNAAQSVADAGRYGDTMLAHITPEEAQLLEYLGGSGTINPETGLPEYFLKKAFKKIKKGVKKVGGVVSKAAPFASLIPGPFGPMASAALGAGGSLVAGKGLKTALKRGIAGGLGGLAIGQMGGAGALGKLGSVFGGKGPAASLENLTGGGIGSSLFGGGGGGFDLNGIGGSLFGGDSSSGGGFLGRTGGFLDDLGGSKGGLNLDSLLGQGGIGGALFGGGGGSGGGSPWDSIGQFLGGVTGMNGGRAGGGSPLGALGAAGLGALAGGLGGGNGRTTETTDSLQPWQKPFVQQAMGAAQQQFQNAGPPPSMSGASINAVNNLASPAATQPFGQIRDQFSALGNQQFQINDMGLQNAANRLAGTQAQQSALGSTAGIRGAMDRMQNAPIAQQGGVADFGLRGAADSLANTRAATAGNAYDGGYLGAANRAAGLKASVGQEGRYISDTLGGKYLNPQSNPYLKATYDKASRSVISNNDSLFASGGRFNSGAAQRALATGLGDMATDLYGQNYQMERGRMENAAQMAAAQSGRQDAMTQFGVGQQLNALGNFGQRQDAANQFNANATNNWNQYTSGQRLNALQNLGQRQDAINQYNVGQTNAMTDSRNALGLQAEQGIFGAQNQNNQFNAAQGNDWNQYTSGQQLNALSALGQRADAMTQFGANNAMQANQGALQAQNSLQGANNDALRAGQYSDAFNYQNWQAPWQNIQNYLGTVGGNYGSSSTTRAPVNTASNVLGGALGGLGIYGQLFNP